MRVLALPSGQQAILSDTVGFVADLPTDLVAAFRATLEEVRTADLVLHVRDMAHPESAAQRQDVLEVLHSLELGDLGDEGRLLEFWNKLDLLPAEDRAQLRSAAERQPATVCGSALTGEGVEALLALLDRICRRRRKWSSWSSTAPTVGGWPGCTATAPSWNGATAMGEHT